MSIIKCPECGDKVSDRAKTCPHCGVAIAGQLTICPDCGEVILKDVGQCPYCHCIINGAELTYVPPVQQEHRQPERGHEADKSDTPPEEQPRKKIKNIYAVVIVSVVLALIVVLLGLYFYQTALRQNEQHAYENAMLSAEPAVLQNFLDVYTDAPSQHADSIKMRLDRLRQIDREWAKALASGRRDELANYVKRYPGNIHVTEANLKIDSIDWQTALNENTPEAFKIYIDEHPDGANVPEARDRYDQLDALRVTPEDQAKVAQLMKNYLNALAQRDENGLMVLMASPVKQYMGVDMPTREDVAGHMRNLFEADVTAVDFRPAGEWEIKKLPAQQEGHYNYAVSGEVEERIDRSEPDKERFVVYKLTAEINFRDKLSMVSMQRVAK